MKKSIATLITCHNRSEKTIACLNSLFHSTLPKNFVNNVFLVDDGSTDGTEELVEKNFPMVNIIKGNGNLYWNQGMRLAWDTALKNGDYDFYLWLNDDTILDKHAITELLECDSEALKKDSNSAIIVGVCRSDKDIDEFSYGGRTSSGPVFPNGNIQQCLFINGNVVLVPNRIFKTIGNLSHEYTHALGDFDYGLTAISAGFKCYVTKGYIAICPKNGRQQTWLDPQIHFLKRWKHLHSPKGLNVKEYLHYKKKHFGIKWISNMFRIYIKVIWPSLYKGEIIK